MAGYNDPDVLDDEGAVADQYLEALADQHEDWEPHDGQIEPPIAEATAVVVAPVNALLKDALRADYAGWATTVLGLPPRAATTAATTVTVTFSGPGTYLAGSRVLAPLPGGDGAVFVTLADATADAAGDVVTGVPAAADAPGADANGAVGVADLVDSFEFVRSVELPVPATGGIDAEDRDSEYLPRVVRRARRFLDLPVTVADYAEAALDVPGVARCLAVNLLDPAHPDQQGTAAAEGHITLFPLTAEGFDFPTPALVLAEVTGSSQRVLQVVAHASGATRTPVAVAFSATAQPGADGEAAVALAGQRVVAYLSGPQWGYDDDAPGKWRTSSVVRYREVEQVVQDTPGVDLLVSLTLNGVEHQDVALPGFAPLPVATVAGELAP